MASSGDESIEAVEVHDAEPKSPSGAALNAGDDDFEKRVQAREERLKEYESVQGDTVKVRFLLPGDETLEHTFTMGQTVADMKLELLRLKDLAYETQSMKHKGQVLIDPLSLSDIAVVVETMKLEGSVDVNVEILGYVECALANHPPSLLTLSRRS